MTRFWTGLICSCGVLTISACATTPKASPEPQVITTDTNIPIAAGCVPANVADAPIYPDTDEAIKAAAGPDQRYQLLYAGRKVRVARLNEIEPIIAGCPKAQPK